MELGYPGCKLRAEPHLPGGGSQAKWTHFPVVETTTFRIRVFLTLKPTRTTSIGLAKIDKGRKLGKQKTIGKLLKYLMCVEKSFHVLVQLWSLGTGVITNTFPRSGGCQHGRGSKTSCWWNALLKHCWLGHVLIIFLLEYDQVCGQRSSRDVVGLVQS